MNRPILELRVEAAGSVEAFLGGLGDVYRDHRDEGYGESMAAAETCGVARSTWRGEYKRKALEGREPYAEIFEFFRLREVEYRREHAPRLIKKIENFNPDRAYRVRFPALAAQIDREIGEAAMVAWVEDFLVEFQEQFTEAVQERAKQEGDGFPVDACLRVTYDALDQVIARHAREAKA